MSRLSFMNMMKEKNKLPLDERLSAVLSLGRNGQVAADIGTDHAYIPIELLLTGRCGRAVAADVNEGPLMRARLNAAHYGVSDKMLFCLSDGLRNIPLAEEGVGDVYICGMGGELIASILDASDYVKNSAVRLILQPMSCAAELRTYLSEAGFRIVREKFATDGERIYQCLAAEYDGTVRHCTPAQAWLGALHIEKGRQDSLFEKQLRRVALLVKQRADGRRMGGVDVAFEEALLSELGAIAEKEGIVI